MPQPPAPLGDPMNKSARSITEAEGEALIPAIIALDPIRSVARMDLPQVPVQIPISATLVITARLKSDLDEDEIHKVYLSFLSLSVKCKRRTTGEYYITSIKAGKNINDEIDHPDRTWAFVVEFASRSDCEYFNREDEAYQWFYHVFLVPLAETFTVVSFVRDFML